MLYIEAPAGVGFSIMGNIANNYTNDNITAQDNLQALVQFFFVKFPEFSSNEFYIAGESYAGIYVPMLADHILTFNSKSTSQKINLKGFMVGNGVTDWNVDADSAWPYVLWWHGLIGLDTHIKWVNNHCTYFTNTTVCNEAYNEMLKLFTGINFYDIYRECITPVYNLGHNGLHRRRWGNSNLGSIENCAPDNGLFLYLNRRDVREALHISDKIGVWNECNNIDYEIFYNLGSYYLYPKLINSNLRIRIYSGDTDTAVATAGTRQWINNLGMQVKTNWTQYSLNYTDIGSQVAGFYETYSNTDFTFMTIKGSGHMCIQWKRQAGHNMYLTFLYGQNP